MDITNDTRYFLKRVLPETSRIPCPLLRYLYAVDVDEWRLFSPPHPALVEERRKHGLAAPVSFLGHTDERVSTEFHRIFYHDGVTKVDL